MYSKITCNVWYTFLQYIVGELTIDQLIGFYHLNHSHCSQCIFTVSSDSYKLTTCTIYLVRVRIGVWLQTENIPSNHYKDLFLKEQNPCWQSQRSDVSCSWPPGGILSHSSLQILSKSLRFRGSCLATRTFSSLHRFSMGFRPGDWLGPSRGLIHNCCVRTKPALKEAYATS